MNDEDLKKLRGVIREEIKEAVDPVSEELSELMVEVKGKVIPDLENLNKSVKNIENKLELSNDNTERVNKRLTDVEGKLGIQPPPELHIVK